MAASENRNQQMKEHIRRTSDLSFIANLSSRGSRDDGQKSRIMEHLKRSLG
jgi:hypothetical protein